MLRFLVLTAAFTLAGPARAQMQFYDGIFWMGQNAGMQNMIGQHGLGEQIKRGASNPGATSGPASTPAPTTLRFRPDPAVTRKVQGQLVARARQSSAGAQGAATLEQALASGELRRGYEAMMGALGGRLDDALDPLTSYLMVVWAISNNTDLSPTPAMFRALRAQVGQAYAAMSARLNTDAGRQEFAETLMYETFMYGSLHDSMLRMEAGERQQLADTMHRAALGTLDLDLRAFALTERGLVGRN